MNHIEQTLTHVSSDQPHPVMERLGIVPVYRVDKVDGSDEASISYGEALVMADMLSAIAIHAMEAAGEGTVSYRDAIVHVLEDLNRVLRDRASADA